MEDHATEGKITKAEAKPEHGPTGPLHKTSGRKDNIFWPSPTEVREEKRFHERVLTRLRDSSRSLIAPKSAGDWIFKSQYWLGLGHRKIDFITLKCNKGCLYQRMDQVRKLVGRYYYSFDIVRSPTGGIHFHAIAARNGPRAIRVRSGVHLDVQTIGYQRPACNRRGLGRDPVPDDYREELLNYVKRTKARKSSVKPVGYADHMEACVKYLQSNLLENAVPDYYRDHAGRKFHPIPVYPGLHP